MYVRWLSLMHHRTAHTFIPRIASSQFVVVTGHNNYKLTEPDKIAAAAVAAAAASATAASPQQQHQHSFLLQTIDET